MFSTCIFCQSNLGRNDQLETFPVGRRIAFDAAKGRLWVICGACKRWNLSPLEERWEAIERSQILIERLHPVAESDRIALYHHPSGLDLVRLGGATWRETALWRYGARMSRRKSVAEIKTVGRVVVTQVVPRVLGATVLASLGPAGLGAGFLGVGAVMRMAQARALRRPVLLLGAEDEPPTIIRRRHLNEARILPGISGGAWALSVDSDGGYIILESADAMRALGHSLIQANARGAATEDLRAAVRAVEVAGSADRYVAGVIDSVRFRNRRTIPLASKEGSFNGPVKQLPEHTRIALEIAAHEEMERLALEGELAALERMWRDAEEIAAIADDMFIPQAVTDAWRRLKGV